MANVAGKLETFERDIKLATTGLDPSSIAAELARFARAELAGAISRGEASASYERYVNGVKDASEDSVIPPGPIVYVFGYWSDIITVALEELRRRVPIRSGRYAGGFIVLADGQPARNIADISPNAEVVILNRQPYTRKMEVGGNGTGRKHFELAGRSVNRQFRGTAVCQVLFLDVTAGLEAGVPYILRGTRRRTTRRVRKDRQPGQPITYPALVLNMVQ